MSIKIMTQIWETKGHFTSSEKFVLLKIADCAADDGTHSFPSIKTIAEQCELGRATVFRVLNNLYEKRILQKIFRITIKGKRSNKYEINLELLNHMVNNPVD